MDKPVAFAIAAHPDDIEFMMAGTLILLGQVGYDLHMMNIANGSHGTASHEREEIIALRTAEARASAELLGAVFHEPMCDDLDIFYERGLLARLTAVIREVEPTILLVHPPQDYMEDHTNACRLAVSAAFARGMRNCVCDPPRPPISTEVTVYHALPYGVRDSLRRVVHAGQYVDIGSVLPKKRAALACHRTQKEWLDVSQGLDSYLISMEEMSRDVGRQSGRFEYAEGWRRHLHLGFCAENADPLSAALNEECILSSRYEDDLGRGLI